MGAKWWIGLKYKIEEWSWLQEPGPDVWPNPCTTFVNIYMKTLIWRVWVDIRFKWHHFGLCTFPRKALLPLVRRNCVMENDCSLVHADNCFSCHRWQFTSLLTFVFAELDPQCICWIKHMKTACTSVNSNLACITSCSKIGPIMVILSRTGPPKCNRQPISVDHTLTNSLFVLHRILTVPVFRLPLFCEFRNKP